MQTIFQSIIRNSMDFWVPCNFYTDCLDKERYICIISKSTIYMYLASGFEPKAFHFLSNPTAVQDFNGIFKKGLLEPWTNRNLLILVTDSFVPYYRLFQFIYYNKKGNIDALATSHHCLLWALWKYNSHWFDGELNTCMSMYTGTTLMY